MCIVALQRQSKQAYIAITCEGQNVDFATVLETGLHHLQNFVGYKFLKTEKLMTWMVHDIYRLSKVSLRDMLHAGVKRSEENNE
jgi:hypothetical protein